MMPWYKHPWVWLIIGLPVISVVGCLFTIYLAYHGADKPISLEIKKQGMFYRESK